MIIDFHTHTFPEGISGKIIDGLTRRSRVRGFTDASRTELLRSMKRSGVDYCLNLPVMTRPDQVIKINRDLLVCHEEMLGKHLLTLGGMHPDFPEYKKELRFLKKNGIPGIKLHPSYQECSLDDARMMHIIDAASELDMIVVIHAGIDVGHPDRNYASVSMIHTILREIQPPKFVLAHMGNWGQWDEVSKELAGANVWLDTAYSLGPVFPNPALEEMPIRPYNLSMPEFTGLCRKHGVDRILFGSDSPWSDQSAYIQMVKHSALSQDEQEKIFWRNAADLLGLSL